MSPVDLAVPVTMSQPRVKPIFFFFILLCPEKNRMWLCHSCTIWKRQSCNGPANNVTCHHVYYSLVDWARSQGVSRNIRPPKIKKKNTQRFKPVLASQCSQVSAIRASDKYLAAFLRENGGNRAYFFGCCMWILRDRNTLQVIRTDWD